MARGVYRIPYFPSDRLGQYREAILWARADSGPEKIALSHETALAVYGISDANPPRVQITVPKSARLRRRSRRRFPDRLFYGLRTDCSRKFDHDGHLRAVRTGMATALLGEDVGDGRSPNVKADCASEHTQYCCAAAIADGELAN